MSRIKTYPISRQDLANIMKTLNLTREDIVRICEGVSANAYAWWQQEERIPVKHLFSLKNEFDLQMKLRKHTELDEVVSKKFDKIFRILVSSGAALKSRAGIHIYDDKGLSGQFDSRAGSNPLSKFTTDELFQELRRRIK